MKTIQILIKESADRGGGGNWAFEIWDAGIKVLDGKGTETDGRAVDLLWKGAEAGLEAAKTNKTALGYDNVQIVSDSEALTNKESLFREEFEEPTVAVRPPSDAELTTLAGIRARI